MSWSASSHAFGIDVDHEVALDRLAQPVEVPLLLGALARHELVDQLLTTSARMPGTESEMSSAAMSSVRCW